MPSYTSGVAGQGTSSSVRSGVRSLRAGLLRVGRSIGRAIFGILLLVPAIVLPASASGAEAPSVSKPTDKSAAAELFAAIDQGAVEAKVVVRDQYHARVILRNKTDAPLTLRLPDAFAARPILAQQGFQFPSPNQSQNKQTQPQAVSGPFSSQSNNQSNQGQQNTNFFGNGNVFNIPPESVRSVSISCFCVEMGKPNPRSIHSYELVRFEQVGGDPQLAAVFDRYARGDLDRESVQAAVWHVVNDKSWDELGKLSRKIALNADAPIFTRAQLQLARDLVAHAAKQAGEHPERYAARPATTRPASGVARSNASAAEPAVGDAGRPIPSSAEKYRTIRAINARR
jgi:hypothetical protein